MTNRAMRAVTTDQPCDFNGFFATVRVPLDANEPLSMDPAASDGLASLDATGQEIAKTNVAAWQTAGYKGGGVKVGIVDFFDGG